MDNPVKIKADANGLIVQLPGEMDFLRIYRLTVRRFTMSAELFSKCGNISIRFIGADLNELQKTWLIDSLNSLDCINTHFIQYKLKKEPVPVESKLPEIRKDTAPSALFVTERKDVLYFHGNMSEGDVLETHKSVVLIGNVEAGARVTTLKNIIIVGELKGLAIAGLDRKRDRYIAALSMRPEIVQIGRYRRYGDGCYDPWDRAAVAVLKNDKIFFRALYT